MFDSLLIANRGEIACRVIRTAKAMGLRTIAVYSSADVDALHVQLADEAVHIGGAAASESYLDQNSILKAAADTNAAAIHPGYGFLSENAGFAEACAKAGVIFVGPPPSAIRAMGLKDGAKILMERAVVPVVPGYHGKRQQPAFLKKKAYEVGYPILIKAVAGGGGKGMRRVDKVIDFDDALAGAVREAENAFGDPHVLIEKFIANPRHIEVQVMAGSDGAVLHLFERDCSLQRRHQKVIEEAPAPGMVDGLRARMGEAACQAAAAVGYRGAGTVEFIVDGSKPLSDNTPFFFMEMNTRLQVEHPVTEAITGLDLVELQLKTATGESLGLTQSDVTINGHALEARVYAEDPDSGFLPSTGRLEAMSLGEGEGIRIETGVRQGDMVSPHYDPMIAKIIAHGPDRDTALNRLSGALRRSRVAGPKTNLALLGALCDAEPFRAVKFDTGTIDRGLSSLLPSLDDLLPHVAAEAASHLVECERKAIAERWTGRVASAWDMSDGFQLGEKRTLDVPIEIDGTLHDVTMRWDRQGLSIAGCGTIAAEFVDVSDRTLVLVNGRQFTARRPSVEAADSGASDDGAVRAPMHGTVIEIAVVSGAKVSRGDRIAVVEAMKMEHAVTAPFDGTVSEVLAEAGAQVVESALLVRINAIK